MKRTSKRYRRALKRREKIIIALLNAGMTKAAENFANSKFFDLRAFCRWIQFCHKVRQEIEIEMFGVPVVPKELVLPQSVFHL